MSNCHCPKFPECMMVSDGPRLPECEKSDCPVKVTRGQFMALFTPAQKHKPTYDKSSYDLAVHFLQDEPSASEKEKIELAIHIQNAVEDWFFSRTKDRP